MADISKITDLSGITYDIKDTVSRNKVQILPPKTYTGIYATANSDAQKRFFFAKVTRVNKDTLWHVRLRYQFSIPEYPTYAYTDWDADLYGLGSAFKSYYVKVNHGANVAMRYLACAWASPTDNNELYLGAMFYAGQNYNKAAYARDLTATIMTYDNCEVEYLDSIKKWGEFNTMIYTVTTIDLNANGYQETGDANSTYNLGNNQLYNTVIAKEAIPAESIICAGSDGKYMKVAAGVTFDYTKQLVWLNAAMAVNGTQYANNFITIYDRNLATSVKPGFSGAANSEVYLVGTIDGNEFTVDEEVVTTEPYSAGKVYMPIGKLGNQSTGANYFYFNPGVNSVLWEYKNDKLQIYAPPQDVSEKADKVSSATSGNFAALDANGNLTDSGHKHSDYLTSHQDISGKADKVSNATNGNFAALDANGNLIDSGHKNADYIPIGAQIMATNPFAGTGHDANALYIPKIDNALFCANKRFSVLATGEILAGSGVTGLFDGSYDQDGVLRIANDKQVVITIDFSDQPNSKMPGYPYGYIFLTFYNKNLPKSISARVYNNYASQGVGWKTITFTNVFGSVYRAKQEYYGLQTIEITITGNGEAPTAGYTSLCEIDMWCTRPSPDNTPFLSKYVAETLYYPLTAPNFIGNVNGYTISKSVPADAKFTDTTYESKAAASGGTDLSLVTTGEKYAWNSAASGAVHDVQIDNTSITVSGVANISTITAAQINALFSSGS